MTGHHLFQLLSTNTTQTYSLQNCCEGITGEHHVITSSSNCTYVLDLTKSLGLVGLKVTMREILLPGKDCEVSALEMGLGVLNPQNTQGLSGGECLTFSLPPHHLARDEHCEKRLPGVLSDQAPESIKKNLVPFRCLFLSLGKKSKRSMKLFSFRLV